MMHVGQLQWWLYSTARVVKGLKVFPRREEIRAGSYGRHHHSPSCLALILLLITCSSPLLSRFSHAQKVALHDTLLQVQVVKDGQTLVSSGQSFELGFFSRAKSRARYVGIWYKNITTSQYRRLWRRRRWWCGWAIETTLFTRSQEQHSPSTTVGT